MKVAPSSSSSLLAVAALLATSALGTNLELQWYTEEGCGGEKFTALLGSEVDTQVCVEAGITATSIRILQCDHVNCVCNLFSEAECNFDFDHLIITLIWDADGAPCFSLDPIHGQVYSIQCSESFR